MSVESPPARARSRRPAPDAACLAAVDVARDAAVLASGDPGAVGDHLGFDVDADRVLTHFFTCLAAGYPGWHWAVTLVRAARARVVTVDEVVLLPGDLALLAPAWLPWNERIRPGDVGPTDLLPAPPGDPRLDPGYTAAPSDVTVEPAADRVDRAAGVGTVDTPATLADALGLGRARVLSPFGRDDAADRWVDADGGPGSDLALAAPAHCSTCGFFVPLAGPLRAAFGVCANAMSPLDARVVSLDSGCGAHSEGGEAGSEHYRAASAASDPVLDDVVLADFSLRADAPVAEPVTDVAGTDAPVGEVALPDAPVDEAVLDETVLDETVVEATGDDTADVAVQELDAPFLDALVDAVLEAVADTEVGGGGGIAGVEPDAAFGLDAGPDPAPDAVAAPEPALDDPVEPGVSPTE